MALIRCKFCDEEISDRAVACHKCGAKLHHSSRVAKEIGNSMGTLLFLLGFIGFFGVMIYIMTHFFSDTTRESVVEGRRGAGAPTAPQSSGAGTAQGAAQTAETEPYEPVTRPNTMERRFEMAVAPKIEHGYLEQVHNYSGNVEVVYAPKLTGSYEEMAARAVDDMFQMAREAYETEKLGTVNEIRFHVRVTVFDKMGQKKILTLSRARITKSIAEQINWANMNNSQFHQLLNQVGAYIWGKSKPPDGPASSGTGQAGTENQPEPTVYL